MDDAPERARSTSQPRALSGGDVASDGAGEPAALRAGHRIELADATGRLGDEELAWLASHAGRALEHLCARGEVRVKVIGDEEMAAAHLEYLEVEGTTDVLTFDMSDEDGMDVDILACIDEAQRRGGELAHARARELLLYIVHGVLHCLGYDDHEPEEYARMHAKEDEILREIGAGATFARVAASLPDAPAPGGRA